ncbi:MAG: RluA family pseudouridine synthase [Lachnospiraceae bacterium]|nr:RluA family pseudouridine synthase [Lachnospiraceae bacterium]
MVEIKIEKKNEGGRFDKFLKRHLNSATPGFIYKMLRKKNITLNDKKASGSEMLKAGDSVKIFFSDETYRKFTDLRSGRSALKKLPAGEKSVKPGFPDLEKLIIYEDENIALINKPVGMLSQRDSEDSESANEYFLKYLLSKEDQESVLKDFNPSVCNRLDRNTSGILIFAKNYNCAKEIADGLRKRTIKKFYLALCQGHAKSRHSSSYLLKDADTNKVNIFDKYVEGSSHIETDYTVERYAGDYTLLRIELLTGKTHQIRAQLSHDGFPILGDPKYGNRRVNARLKEEYGITNQLLHAHEIIMPEFKGVLNGISGKTFTAQPPETFDRVIGGVY